MQQRSNRCTKYVGYNVECSICKAGTYRHGRTITGKQRYKCKTCNKTFIKDYTYQSYIIPDNTVTALVKEGCGIRSIARLLRICCTTVLKRILSIAKNIPKPI